MKPRWLDALLHSDTRVAGWGKAVGAVAGAVAAVLGVIFLALPQFKPDEPCAGQKTRGDLSDVIVDSSVTYGGYLTLQQASREGVDREQLRAPGKLITAKVSADGFKGKELPLRWTVVHERGQPVTDENLLNRLALKVKMQECSDEALSQVWARDPSVPGEYKIKLVLYNDHGGFLDQARSDVFTIPS